MSGLVEVDGAELLKTWVGDSSNEVDTGDLKIATFDQQGFFLNRSTRPKGLPLITDEERAYTKDPVVPMVFCGVGLTFMVFRIHTLEAMQKLWDMFHSGSITVLFICTGRVSQVRSI